MAINFELIKVKTVDGFLEIDHPATKGLKVQILSATPKNVDGALGFDMEFEFKEEPVFPQGMEAFLSFMGELMDSYAKTDRADRAPAP